MACPKAVRLGRRGNGLPLDAKVWSVSKKMATPLATMEKARNGFFRRQEKKVPGTSSFRDRGVAAFARALGALGLSPGTLELQEHTAPE